MNSDGGGVQAPQRFDDAAGVTPPSSPEGRSGFLSDVIAELGFATPAEVDEAVELSRLEGRTPGEILVEQRTITDEQLARATAERNGLPYVDLLSFRVDDAAARLIPSDAARRYRAVPIAFDADGVLVVAIGDPLDALAVSDIGVITKSKTRVAVASDDGLESVLVTLPESQRRAPLSARGMDGFAGARSADGWSLEHSISSPGTPPPSAAPPAPATTPVPAHAAPVAPEPVPFQGTADTTPPAVAPAAAPSDLDSRIESLVAAALDKHLQGGPAPAADPNELEQAKAALSLTRVDLAQAREEAKRAYEETARVREEADLARAEVAALSARLKQLERMQRSASPAPDPALRPPQAPSEPLLRRPETF